ncbi:hypothetical protein AB0M00_43900 [Streptomyces chartreusis]|uniref:hypothetical protein n=1 Tax=Streptomyces chartreusis TaxID=1969 RepID=UPI003413AAF0
MPRATTPPDTVEPHDTGAGLQRVVVYFGMGIATMVVGTALYGPDKNSERAFRILHWWKRDPEPAPAVEQRAPRAKRR